MSAERVYVFHYVNLFWIVDVLTYEVTNAIMVGWFFNLWNLGQSDLYVPETKLVLI